MSSDSLPRNFTRDYFIYVCDFAKSNIMNVRNNDHTVTLLYTIIYVITVVVVFIKNVFIQNSSFLYGHTHMHIHNNDFVNVPTRIPTVYTRIKFFIYECKQFEMINKIKKSRSTQLFPCRSAHVTQTLNMCIRINNRYLNDLFHNRHLLGECNLK